MAKSLYEKDSTKIRYEGDMSGTIEIEGLNGSATIPAQHLLAFIAHNMMYEDNSIFRRITHTKSIPIEKIHIDFEAVRRIEKSDDFECNKTEKEGEDDEQHI